MTFTHHSAMDPNWPIFTFQINLPFLTFYLFLNTLLRCGNWFLVYHSNLFIVIQHVWVLQVEDHTSKEPEDLTLKRLCVETSQHHFRWTVFYREFSRLNPVRDEKIPDVDVAGLSTT